VRSASWTPLRTERSDRVGQDGWTKALMRAETVQMERDREAEAP